MTGGSQNIKFVEKSLFDLFTHDVVQSVHRSRGKDSGNPRKQRAFEAIEEIPEDDDDTHLDDDVSENDDPYVDEDGNFLATEDVVSDVDHDLAIDDEDYHEALFGYREARLALLVDSILLLSPSVQTSLQEEEKVNPQVARLGRGSKGSGRSSDSRGRIRKGKGRDVPDQLMTVHRVHKSVSSVVQLIIGQVIVRRWMMVLPIRRSEILEPTTMVHGPAATLTVLVMKSGRIFRLMFRITLTTRFLCGAAVSLVQDDDECEAHVAFLVESEGFGVLDCGATTSSGSVEGAEALFSKVHEHDTRIPDVDPVGGSLNLGDGASSKVTSLSRLPVRNEALGDF